MEMANPPDVEVRRVWYWYEGPVLALQDVSLTLAAGDFLALVGQNGSGKTTLAKHFNGLLRPGRGEIFVAGSHTAGRTVGDLSRTVGYVFQNPDHQIFSATVREELAFGPLNLGLDKDAVRERVEESLGAFDLEDYAEAPPAVLPFSLKRRVTLASVYAMHTQVLVLDEPTVGLDRRAASDLMERVSGLNRAGRTVVLITHDMRLVAERAARMAVLHEGRLLRCGPTRELMADSGLLATAFLSRPQIAQLSVDLKPFGSAGQALTVEEMYAEILAAKGRRPEEPV
jgi:energy-coupling factor transport system ATP-binding protein